MPEAMSAGAYAPVPVFGRLPDTDSDARRPADRIRPGTDSCRNHHRLYDRSLAGFADLGNKLEKSMRSCEDGAGGGNRTLIASLEG